MSAKLSNKTKEFSVKNSCADENTFDIRGVKVLTKNDWNRINYRLHQNDIEAEKERKEKEKREELKKCSQDKVKNWTNTVLGARQKKLEERNIRLESEEKARKEVDLKEAEYQAEKRRKAIEEAKKKQYYQTDRVKNFHSALIHTEVLKEREAQIALKRLKEQSECNQDDQYLAKAKREHEEAIRADQEKAAERNKKTKDNIEYLKSQMKFNEEQKNREQYESQKEGDNIRRLAIAYALEKQRLDQLDREEKRALRQEYLQQIDDVDRMREIERLKDEEDDEEIRIFAAAKKKMLKLRLQKEKEMHEQKQSNLESIKDQLSNQLKLKMDDEDQRIRNAIAEKEEKFNLDEAEKQRRREEVQRQIDQHRLESIARIEHQKRESQKRDMDALIAKKEADAVLRENELHRQRLRMEEIKRIANDNLENGKVHRESDEFSRANQQRVQAETQALLDLEESVFQEYAQKVIAHSKAGGRNVMPLVHAAARGQGGGLGPILPGGAVRPSYKTADNKQTELLRWQTKEACDKKLEDAETTKNLGFVW